MRKVLTAGLLAILTTTFSMAQTNEREILSDELCDKLCDTAHEKSKEMGIDISFAIADRHGLPRVYRRYGNALVLSITLVPGKAYTSAVTQCKTKDVAAVAVEGAPADGHPDERPSHHTRCRRLSAVCGREDSRRDRRGWWHRSAGQRDCRTRGEGV